MRQPLRVNRARRPVSKVVTVPPPIGGWNARDPLPMMKPEDAIELINIIPGTASATLRKGRTVFATGMDDAVESLMEYSPATGVDEFYAAAGTVIYDITTGTPASAVTSLLNARFQHVNFTTSANHFLVAVNGADPVQNYNGTSWSEPTINNVTSADLINVSVHAQRLFFVEKDSMSAWYLGAAAISGDAAELPIGQFCNLGGYLVATGSWTRDGGSGISDLFVLVTSKGQVVIYSGIDPTSAETWILVGVFRIPEPIGRRCLVQAGSDLGVLTKAGLIPLSQVLSQAETVQTRFAITDKISNAFVSAAESHSATFGWGVTEYPREKLLLVNVPVQGGVLQEQYVMNTDSGSWCRFRGFNVNCWSLFGDNLYGGTNDGEVIKYGPDYLDEGMTIQAVNRQAFSEMGSADFKRATAVRPRFSGELGYTPGVEIKFDYDLSAVTAQASVAATVGAEWDLAEWDIAEWPDSAGPVHRWLGANGQGLCLAPAYAINQGLEFTLYGTDVMFERGGPF